MKCCLGVFVESEIIGVLIFGRPIARQEDQIHTLELTRMFLFDSPKNSESKALSLVEKYIKKHMPDICRLIAYSDTQHGHTGTIYKAANWTFEKKMVAKSWGNRPKRKGKIGGDKLKFQRILVTKN